MTAMSASPAATIAAAPAPRGVALTLTLSAIPSRGKTSFVRKMPLVLLGTATVLTSGFGAPARTATPRGVRAKSTSVPAAIRCAAISSVRPSLERMTTSVATLRASCAAMVCGPVPCDEPEPVVILMPVVRSNSGNSCSYGPENPPDIITFNCADAASGHISSVATTTIAFAALHLRVEKAYILGSSLPNALLSRWLGCLQPAAHGRLVVQVLRTEFPFQVLLFFAYDDIVDERHRRDKRGEQPHAIDPD